ncbi:MAG: BON domain-containing protein [Chitinophagaceae bacterium]|nr:BON domain-containing protein [Chitinophagaceae bacterium]
MKSIKTSIRLIITVLAFSGITLISCKGKQTDAEIQTSINEKIASTDQMKGLNASVKDGVVTLSGECPTEECRKDCADAVKGMKGVKDIDNNIRVASAVAQPAPVEITVDETLKTSVNDVIKNYKGVEADVKDGVVTLRGEIKRSSLQDLIVSLNELKPRKVENQLVIK